MHHAQYPRHWVLHLNSIHTIELCWSETQNCWLVQFQAHLRALFVYVLWCLEDYRELAVTQEKVDKRSKCGGLGVAAMDGPYFMLRLDLVHYYYLLISQKEWGPLFSIIKYNFLDLSNISGHAFGVCMCTVVCVTVIPLLVKFDAYYSKLFFFLNFFQYYCWLL